MRLDIDLTPNENLAYVVGALKGDGCHLIYKNDFHAIRFGVTNKLFFDSVKTSMEKIGMHGGVYKTTYDNPNWNDMYRLSIYAKPSKLFGEFYGSLNLWDFLSTEEMKIAFVRGFYEAEGSLFFTNKQKKYKRLEIINTNTNLINLVKTILRYLEFKPKVNKSDKNRKLTIYHLCLCKQEEIARFIYVIKPCIKNDFDCSSMLIPDSYIKFRNSMTSVKKA